MPADGIEGQPPGPVDVFYSDDYVGSATAFDTTRKAGLLAADLRAHPIDGVRMREPEKANPAALERVHEAGFVRAVITGVPSDLAGSAGLGWDEGFATAVLASTGGCVAAANSAWPHGTAGSLSSGLHHARSNRGAGYCTLNGVALAALTFLDCGAKHVLVLDLDAHCGGGTADILGDELRVTQVDVATDSFDRYNPRSDWTLDLIHDAGDYLATVGARLSEPSHASVDAIVYNAGMDPHENCATGGLDGIDDDLLAEREHLVFAWAAARRTPIAFVLAGGYSAGAMGTEHLTALHRLTIEAAAAAHRC